MKRPNSLLTSEPQKRGNRKQIKLDYNSTVESSAYSGQQSIFADLSASQKQICITTGQSMSSYCGFQISHLNPHQNELFQTVDI